MAVNGRSPAVGGLIAILYLAIAPALLEGVIKPQLRAQPTGRSSAAASSARITVVQDAAAGVLCLQRLIDDTGGGGPAAVTGELPPELSPGSGLLYWTAKAVEDAFAPPSGSLFAARGRGGNGNGGGDDSYHRVLLGTTTIASAGGNGNETRQQQVLWAANDGWALVTQAFYRMLTLGFLLPRQLDVELSYVPSGSCDPGVTGLQVLARVPWPPQLDGGTDAGSSNSSSCPDLDGLLVLRDAEAPLDANRYYLLVDCTTTAALATTASAATAPAPLHPWSAAPLLTAAAAYSAALCGVAALAATAGLVFASRRALQRRRLSLVMALHQLQEVGRVQLPDGSFLVKVRARKPPKLPKPSKLAAAGVTAAAPAAHHGGGVGGADIYVEPERRGGRSNSLSASEPLKNNVTTAVTAAGPVAEAAEQDGQQQHQDAAALAANESPEPAHAAASPAAAPAAAARNSSSTPAGAGGGGAVPASKKPKVAAASAVPPASGQVYMAANAEIKARGDAAAAAKAAAAATSSIKIAPVPSPKPAPPPTAAVAPNERTRAAAALAEDGGGDSAGPAATTATVAAAEARRRGGGSSDGDAAAGGILADLARVGPVSAAAGRLEAIVGGVGGASTASSAISSTAAAGAQQQAGDSGGGAPSSGGPGAAGIQGSAAREAAAATESVKDPAAAGGAAKPPAAAPAGMQGKAPTPDGQRTGAATASGSAGRAVAAAALASQPKGDGDDRQQDCSEGSGGSGGEAGSEHGSLREDPMLQHGAGAGDGDGADGAVGGGLMGFLSSILGGGAGGRAGDGNDGGDGSSDGGVGGEDEDEDAGDDDAEDEEGEMGEEGEEGEGSDDGMDGDGAVISSNKGGHRSTRSARSARSRHSRRRMEGAAPAAGDVEEAAAMSAAWQAAAANAGAEAVASGGDGRGVGTATAPRHSFWDDLEEDMKEPEDDGGFAGYEFHVKTRLGAYLPLTFPTTPSFEATNVLRALLGFKYFVVLPGGGGGAAVDNDLNSSSEYAAVDSTAAAALDPTTGLPAGGAAAVGGIAAAGKLHSTHAATGGGAGPPPSVIEAWAAAAAGEDSAAAGLTPYQGYVRELEARLRRDQLVRARRHYARVHCTENVWLQVYQDGKGDSRFATERLALPNDHAARWMDAHFRATAGIGLLGARPELGMAATTAATAHERGGPQGTMNGAGGTAGSYFDAPPELLAMFRRGGGGGGGDAVAGGGGGGGGATAGVSADGDGPDGRSGGGKMPLPAAAVVPGLPESLVRPAAEVLGVAGLIEMGVSTAADGLHELWAMLQTAFGGGGGGGGTRATAVLDGGATTKALLEAVLRSLALLAVEARSPEAFTKGSLRDAGGGARAVEQLSARVQATLRATTCEVVQQFLRDLYAVPSAALPSAQKRAVVARLVHEVRVAASVAGAAAGGDAERQERERSVGGEASFEDFALMDAASRCALVWSTAEAELAAAQAALEPQSRRQAAGWRFVQAASSKARHARSALSRMLGLRVLGILLLGSLIPFAACLIAASTASLWAADGLWITNAAYWLLLIPAAVTTLLLAWDVCNAMGVSLSEALGRHRPEGPGHGVLMSNASFSSSNRIVPLVAEAAVAAEADPYAAHRPAPRPSAPPSWARSTRRWVRRLCGLLLALHIAAIIWYCLMLLAWVGLSAMLGALQAVSVLITVVSFVAVIAGHMAWLQQHAAQVRSQLGVMIAQHQKAMSSVATRLDLQSPESAIGMDARYGQAKRRQLSLVMHYQAQAMLLNVNRSSHAMEDRVAAAAVPAGWVAATLAAVTLMYGAVLVFLYLGTRAFGLAGQVGIALVAPLSGLATYAQAARSRAARARQVRRLLPAAVGQRVQTAKDVAVGREAASGGIVRLSQMPHLSNESLDMDVLVDRGIECLGAHLTSIVVLTVSSQESQQQQGTSNMPAVNKNDPGSTAALNMILRELSKLWARLTDKAPPEEEKEDLLPLVFACVTGLQRDVSVHRTDLRDIATALGVDDWRLAGGGSGQRGAPGSLHGKLPDLSHVPAESQEILRRIKALSAMVEQQPTMGGGGVYNTYTSYASNHAGTRGSGGESWPSNLFPQPQTRERTPPAGNLPPRAVSRRSPPLPAEVPYVPVHSKPPPPLPQPPQKPVGLEEAAELLARLQRCVGSAELLDTCLGAMTQRVKDTRPDADQLHAVMLGARNLDPSLITRTAAAIQDLPATVALPLAAAVAAVAALPGQVAPPLAQVTKAVQELDASRLKDVQASIDALSAENVGEVQTAINALAAGHLAAVQQAIDGLSVEHLAEVQSALDGLSTEHLAEVQKAVDGLSTEHLAEVQKAVDGLSTEHLAEVQNAVDGLSTEHLAEVQKVVDGLSTEHLAEVQKAVDGLSTEHLAQVLTVIKDLDASPVAHAATELRKLGGAIDAAVAGALAAAAALPAALEGPLKEVEARVAAINVSQLVAIQAAIDELDTSVVDRACEELPAKVATLMSGLDGAAMVERLIAAVVEALPAAVGSERASAVVAEELARMLREHDAAPAVQVDSEQLQADVRGAVRRCNVGSILGEEVRRVLEGGYYVAAVPDTGADSSSGNDAVEASPTGTDGTVATPEAATTVIAAGGGGGAAASAATSSSGRFVPGPLHPALQLMSTLAATDMVSRLEKGMAALEGCDWEALKRPQQLQVADKQPPAAQQPKPAPPVVEGGRWCSGNTRVVQAPAATSAGLEERLEKLQETANSGLADMGRIDTTVRQLEAALGQVISMLKEQPPVPNPAVTEEPKLRALLRPDREEEGEDGKGEPAAQAGVDLLAEVTRLLVVLKSDLLERMGQVESGLTAGAKETTRRVMQEVDAVARAVAAMDTSRQGAAAGAVSKDDVNYIIELLEGADVKLEEADGKLSAIRDAYAGLPSRLEVALGAGLGQRPLFCEGREGLPPRMTLAAMLDELRGDLLARLTATAESAGAVSATQAQEQQQQTDKPAASTGGSSSILSSAVLLTELAVATRLLRELHVKLDSVAAEVVDPDGGDDSGGDGQGAEAGGAGAVPLKRQVRSVSGVVRRLEAWLKGEEPQHQDGGGSSSGHGGGGGRWPSLSAMLQPMLDESEEQIIAATLAGTEEQINAAEGRLTARVRELQGDETDLLDLSALPPAGAAAAAAAAGGGTVAIAGNWPVLKRRRPAASDIYRLLPEVLVALRDLRSQPVVVAAAPAAAQPQQQGPLAGAVGGLLGKWQSATVMSSIAELRSRMEQLHVLFASSGDVWRMAVPKFVEAARDMLADMLDMHRFTDRLRDPEHGATLMQVVERLLLHAFQQQQARISSGPAAGKVLEARQARKQVTRRTLEKLEALPLSPYLRDAVLTKHKAQLVRFTDPDWLEFTEWLEEHGKEVGLRMVAVNEFTSAPLFPAGYSQERYLEDVRKAIQGIIGGRATGGGGGSTSGRRTARIASFADASPGVSFVMGAGGDDDGGGGGFYPADDEPLMLGSPGASATKPAGSQSRRNFAQLLQSGEASAAGGPARPKSAANGGRGGSSRPVSAAPRR
ncbi:hypothetical protein HXX76_003936 [Chlamydomonas incerta]|uniref:Uncharacterized protein n=1 Tax=Chlamydomonas incerta TaxID=51695 RepID=A0A835T9G2_CHLIN|nr:hypothetical protein HXX76_003936 [Chlamydomonas incerta]|eukprot:KAG2441083.1 hypothetical protein HXX76_003936 [Chlamydomonas incerta]